MQTPSIPAWTYQPPRSPDDDLGQMYYRTGRVFVAAEYPKQRAPNPSLIVFRAPERRAGSLDLEVSTGCGSARIELGLSAALALRDALNDAIEDIVHAQLLTATQRHAEVPA